MKKLVVLGLAFAILAVLAYAGVTGPAIADDPVPCARTKFETKLIAKACKAGGQKAAKKAMKGFVKEVKAAKKAAGEDSFKLTCTVCHKKLGHGYPLKPDGLKTFKGFKAFLDKKKK